MKNILALAAFALTLPLFASAALEKQGEFTIQSKLSYVRLSVEAKCSAPRSEDDGFTVRYTKESYAEIEAYRGYSTKLLGRTCGQFGSPTELSRARFEKVEVLLYNYGSANTDFNDQIRKLIQSL